jgi:hypothetical protein
VQPAASIDEPGFKLCVYSKCPYKQSCTGGNAANDEETGAEGCCIDTPGTVYANTDCDGTDDSTDVFMLVYKQQEPVCTDYTLSYRYGYLETFSDGGMRRGWSRPRAWWDSGGGVSSEGGG